jgi:N6-adenosine-specific RNA methylase IME4
MTNLVRYEAARRALVEATEIDEVKQIRDRMAAMQAYARMAKDSELIDRATDLRKRAERRGGEMLAEMKANGTRDSGGGNRNPTLKLQAGIPKLSDLGVTAIESHRWQKLAAMPDAEFERFVEAAKREAVRSIEVSAAERAQEKKERRDEREAVLGAKIAALPERRYGVILADPEWRFETYSRETGMDRAADNHYPTSDLETIKSRPVSTIAADDCVLFLWATAPMLPQALDVMGAWGFRYASQFVWAKDRIGTGFWNRNKHELLLIGVRGSPPAPAMGTQADSLIGAPVGRHSEKPAIFYEIIEAYFPTLPKIELNARASRSGWDAWGFEAEPEEAAE